MLARAVFGNRGMETVRVPRYESRSWEVTDRIDTPTEHYVGGQYSHTTTSTRHETRFENRPTRVGVDHIDHETIDVVYEFPENGRMTMRRPYWAHRGEVVYVMCHRGVGRPVYDLYCPVRDQWADLQTDLRRPLSWKVPLAAGAAELFLQVRVVHGPETFAYAIATTIATYGLMAMRRGWHMFQLRRSRIRGNDQMIDLIRADVPDSEDIRRRIMERVG
jgi:hypothetical protein